MTRLLRSLTCVAALATATPALAQSMPAWDAAVNSAFVVAHPPPVAQSMFSDAWTQTGSVGVSAGRYWTPHFKTELEFLATGEPSRYVTRPLLLPGESVPYPLAVEQYSSLRAVAGTVSWQFFENQWVHPFVTAGVEFDIDRTRLHTFQQVLYTTGARTPGSTPYVVAPESDEEAVTTRRLAGVLGGGAKLYVAPRLFFRTDARVAIARQRSGHVAFRLGFGFDF